MCGGGGAGQSGSYTGDENTTSTRYFMGGIGGSGGYVSSGNLTSGLYNVVIGSGGNSSAGSATKIGTNTANGGGQTNSGIQGGSGGGGAGSVYGSTSTYYEGSRTIPAAKGAGVSTYPFGLTSLKAHSAGGGGGGAAKRWTQEDVSNAFGRANGCPGGTNGGDGSSTANPTYVAETNAGGVYGGGDGKNMETGGNATFYGGGGGGGASNFDSNYAGGSGYQGVVYILIKK